MEAKNTIELPGPQMVERGLRHRERRDDVDPHLPLEALERGVLQRQRLEEARAVDEAVEAAERADRLLDDPGRRREILEVGVDRMRRPAALLDLGHLGGHSVLVAADERYGGARRAERANDLRADPRRGPRDDDGLPGETPVETGRFHATPFRARRVTNFG